MEPRAAAQLLATLRASVIGEGIVLRTPYGPRRLTYADYTATGRALALVEDPIRRHVLPTLANTHTEANATGAQTTLYREEARAIIHRSVGATDEDVVIFCGTGATGAVDKLSTCMGLRIPCCLEDRYGLVSKVPKHERPVIFIGPYEHHSNELPWRESIGEVVVIEPCKDGLIDLDDLERKLRLYKDRPLKIGSFSAASNVTGIISDVDRIATLLHDEGAVAFFDYAAAGPYVHIDMNPDRTVLAYKDAIFLSPHKFPGGPGTPGVLVVKKRLFANRVPAVPGGGTVSYADTQHHVYVVDAVQREEGGTPDIIGSIRAGLVFALKDQVTTEVIEVCENAHVRKAIAAWSGNPAITVLGNTDVDRLATISFTVNHGAKALHYNFVVTLLNDLFGIQARGGMSCAAPYGHRLLGISESAAIAIEELVVTRENGGGEGAGIRPGWTRVSFAYYDSPETVDYVIAAVDLIAREGWRALVDYDFDPSNGRWTHRGGKAPLLCLDDLAKAPPAPVAPESVRWGYIAEARRILSACGERCRRLPPVDKPAPSTSFERLRWFWIPSEMAPHVAAAPVIAITEEDVREAKDALVTSLRGESWLRGIGIFSNEVGDPCVSVMVLEGTDPDEVRHRVPTSVHGVCVLVRSVVGQFEAQEDAETVP